MTNALNNNLSKFPEFEVLLNEQFKQRLPMDFDITKLKSSYFHLALGLTENCHWVVYIAMQMQAKIIKCPQNYNASIQYAIDQASNQNLKGVNTSFCCRRRANIHPSLLKERLVPSSKNAKKKI